MDKRFDIFHSTSNEIPSQEYELCSSILRKKPDSILKNVEYLYIDLSTQWNTSILPNDIDIIIHLAQSSKFRDFPSEAEDIFNVNIKSTAQLLDFARKNNIQKHAFCPKCTALSKMKSRNVKSARNAPTS